MKFLHLKLTGFPQSPATSQVAYRAAVDWFTRDGGAAPDIAAVQGGGQTGRPVRFKTAHAKVEKADDAALKFFLLGHKDDNPATIQRHATYSGDMEERASLELHCSSRDDAVALEFLLERLPELVAAFDPDYGQVTTSIEQEDHPLVVPGLPRPLDDMAAGWLRHGFDPRKPMWRDGKIGAVDCWNLVPEAVLSAPIEGTTLRHWIEADTARGQLRALSPRLWLWSVGLEERAALFKRLWDECIVFDDDRYEHERLWREIDAAVLAKSVDGQTLREAIASNPRHGRVERRADGRFWWGVGRTWENQRTFLMMRFHLESDLEKTVVRDATWHPKPAPPAPIPGRVQALPKRNRLIARVEKLEADGGEAVVGVDEFFDGNRDHWSLDKCHEILAQIRDREDVQAVLVAIASERMPDPDVDDDDEWPGSDTVFILASATLRDVKRWARALVADETRDFGQAWPDGTAPAGAPALDPDTRVFSLWWD
jgi:hypothetical protein